MKKYLACIALIAGSVAVIGYLMNRKPKFSRVDPIPIFSKKQIEAMRGI